MTEFAEWIGQQQTHSELLTEALVARFRDTFPDPEPLPGSTAPSPLIHFCLANGSSPSREIGDDGHPSKGGFLPEVGLPARMWAAGSVWFHEPMRVGQIVRRVSSLRNVVRKKGRSGDLCFVTVDHEIHSGGVLAITEEQTIVYREPTPGIGDRSRTCRPLPAPVQSRIAMSPILLFRYSALTFNAHRIHYDRPYAIDIEGYPGLVVHGPLQATLLCRLATRSYGAMPRHFAFRSLAPAFEGADLALCAQETETGLTLWAATDGGTVTMEATAQW